MSLRPKWVGAAAAVALAGLAAGALPARATPDPRALAERAARVEVARFAAGAGGPVDCLGSAGDPAPGTAAWNVRDAENQYCSTLRQADEYGSPAFGTTFWSETPGIFAAQTLAQAMDPSHPHASLGQLVPGGTTADPFRTLDRWVGAGKGRVTPISFTASDGARLNGYLFAPPGPARARPGVVITTGSIQGYQQIYFWAAEGLAEAGYLVMTYDVQGQGDSDTLPASCAPTAGQLQQGSVCPGVPFQQNYNFFQGTRDALDFFFSTPSHPSGGSYNPDHDLLDRHHVGLAGHSLGAAAVSQVGQEDPRVSAIVAWDNLAPATGTKLHAPALGINSEYFLNPTPATTPPDPHAKDQAFRQLAAAGVDTMQIGLRSSTHLEYSYIPYLLPASRLGERVAFYYTLAWFDRYLRGSPTAFDRLIAGTFDASADTHSIGAGTYDLGAAGADPADPAAGNRPYLIKGLPVADRLSFYYLSEYSLTSPAGTRADCSDMRHGCR